MKPHLRSSLTLLIAALLAGPMHSLGAQGDIQWTPGPTVGRLGSIAQITIPEGYSFTGKAGAQRFMELTENPSSGDELGVLIPNTDDDDEFWFVVFEFKQMGYVKDDEKAALDADDILKSIRKGNDAGNKIRRKRGWPTLSVVGWEKEPFYDANTNNLTWAIRGAVDDVADSGESVNYSTRVLGRRGTMNVDLVIDPALVEHVVPEFEWLLTQFEYLSGNRYAEWVEGDAVAKYGLTALVAGGAGALAVKSGLLQKFGKLILVAIAAIVSAVARSMKSLGRLFGRGDESQQPSRG
ncbi:MAG TPA: DUF2167 domain-containing protein [Gemmatimonadaceae bacterium]|nr:DUF2167 domain-containing protein [Gemmatimonadaceae bacterium]